MDSAGTKILPFRGPSESSCFEHLKKGWGYLEIRSQW